MANDANKESVRWAVPVQLQACAVPEMAGLVGAVTSMCDNVTVQHDLLGAETHDMHQMSCQQGCWCSCNRY